MIVPPLPQPPDESAASPHEAAARQALRPAGERAVPPPPSPRAGPPVPPPPPPQRPVPLSAPTPAAAAQAAPRAYVVQEGDTLSSIAAAVLGDANRWPEIFEANRGMARLTDGRTLADPDLIWPGLELALAAPPAPAPAAAPQPAPQVYVVQEGDTLSGIAEEVLGDANRWPEIFEANRGTARLDDDRTLTDPDVIWPGLELMVPTPWRGPSSASPAPEGSASAPAPPAPQPAPPATGAPSDAPPPASDGEPQAADTLAPERRLSMMEMRRPVEPEGAPTSRAAVARSPEIARAVPPYVTEAGPEPWRAPAAQPPEPARQAVDEAPPAPGPLDRLGGAAAWLLRRCGGCGEESGTLMACP